MSNGDVAKHDEYQYLDLVQKIMKEGAIKGDRTGVIPLLTTKRVFWRGVVEELLWFIRGSTNSKELSDKGVKIWDANGSREFLDNLGFKDRQEGDLGPVYGFQWRHCGAEYIDMNTNYEGKGIDQLNNLLDMIKNNPNDRRMILCSWNVSDIPKMALPPCHCLVQFNVTNGKLNCMLTQRSGDMGLGVPFNIASYSLLTHIMAKAAKLEAGEFVHTIGDAHIYLNHLDALKEQCTRIPRPFPRLRIKREEISRLDDLHADDFDLIEYNPHPRIPMDLSV